jgi:transcriptional regulator with XRE-family HTH domain
MEAIAQTLGRSLKRLRQHRELTQSELAKKADISLTFLQNIEAGRRWVGPDTIASLAKSLQVSESALFSSADVPEYALPGKKAASRLSARAAITPPDPREVLELFQGLLELCREPECNYTKLRESLKALSTQRKKL